MFLWNNCTKPHQICARCSHIQCAFKLPIGILIFISQWQHDKQKFFHEKRHFCDFNWLRWQRTLSHRQINAKFIKHLQSSSNA